MGRSCSPNFNWEMETTKRGRRVEPDGWDKSWLSETTISFPPGGHWLGDAANDLLSSSD
jgi:hypothetical protein